MNDFAGFVGSIVGLGWRFLFFALFIQLASWLFADAAWLNGDALLNGVYVMTAITVSGFFLAVLMAD